MKHLIFALALMPASLFAHEGHDHGTTSPATKIPTDSKGEVSNAVECLEASAEFSQLAAHLSYPIAGVHVHAYWKQTPVLDKPAILKLELRDAATHALSSLQTHIDVVVFHEDMGHESIPTKINAFHDDVGDLVTGSFLVSRIDFSMPGTWSVKVNLTGEKGEIETKQFSLSF